MGMRPVHTMPEALISRPSALAWGCTQSQGWVPFPKKIPRRHPLIDTVGRIDDPCDRPVYNKGKPSPAFGAPQEGYPNDVCHIEDYKKSDGEAENDNLEYPPGSAVIHVGKNTPQAIQLRVPAVYLDENGNPQGSESDTCQQKSYGQLLPPSQAWLQAASPCHPNNPDYPCTGIINEIMRDFQPPPEKQKCPPRTLFCEEQPPPNWQEEMQITGWENIMGERTCDLFKIAEDLPARFNNPRWFTGYGCEKITHPFYVTTMSDYGRFSPNPTTMPLKYYPRTQTFSTMQAAGGMWRNRTLNTSNTKSIV